MALEMVVCPNCRVRVVPMKDGRCPSCRKSFEGTSKITERMHSKETKPSIEKNIMKQKTSADSDTTRILLANAHLHNNDVYNLLNARRKKDDNFKADTPEYFIDCDEIMQESKKGRARENIRRALLLIAAFYAFISIGSSLSSLILPLVFMWVIELIVEMLRQSHVRKIFLVQNYYEEVENDEGGNENKEDDISNNQEQNVVISGGYSPFLGSGYDIFGWSFTVDLTKPEKESVPPEKLNIRELYQEASENISRLGIRGLAIKDRLLVNGQDIRHNRTFLPNIFAKPNITVSQEVIDDYITNNDSEIRHYKMIQIPAWKGQLVLTIYFRFLKIGESLFVESRFFLLTPLKDKFLQVDNLTKEITLKQLIQIVTTTLLKAPFTWIGAIIWVLSGFNKIQEAIFPQEWKKVKNNEKYNYGWTQSLREAWSQEKYERYFQMLDRDMYFKIIQQRLIDSITESLESKGISTEALKDRGTTILNEGVIITGGSLKAESMAVGKEASSAVKNIVNAAKKRATKSKGNTLI
jgi:hypothetical protein